MAERNEFRCRSLISKKEEMTWGRWKLSAFAHLSEGMLSILYGWHTVSLEP